VQTAGFLGSGEFARPEVQTRRTGSRRRLDRGRGNPTPNILTEPSGRRYTRESGNELRTPSSQFRPRYPSIWMTPTRPRSAACDRPSYRGKTGTRSRRSRPNHTSQPQLRRSTSRGERSSTRAPRGRDSVVRSPTRAGWRTRPSCTSSRGRRSHRWYGRRKTRSEQSPKRTPPPPANYKDAGRRPVNGAGKTGTRLTGILSSSAMHARQSWGDGRPTDGSARRPGHPWDVTARHNYHPYRVTTGLGPATSAGIPRRP